MSYTEYFKFTTPSTAIMTNITHYTISELKDLDFSLIENEHPQLMFQSKVSLKLRAVGKCTGIN